MDINQWTKDTFVKEKTREINTISDKAINTMTWNKFFTFWGYMWAWYYITFTFIAPIFKSAFLIANWVSVITFYGVMVLIWAIIWVLFNTLIKLLLYVFKS